MREIRTSGSTRGGALRSPPTLPVLNRARQQAAVDEFVHAVGVQR